MRAVRDRHSQGTYKCHFVHRFIDGVAFGTVERGLENAASRSSHAPNVTTDLSETIHDSSCHPHLKTQ